MKMQKRQFRIGQLAENLGVERFVVRFWEKEFKLACDRSDGGQRFYSEQDLEDSPRLPGGNIFHGALAWPFAEDGDDLGTPAKRWGVATRQENLLVCGSGARRGGAVSGIAGHNAAQAVLELFS